VGHAHQQHQRQRHLDGHRYGRRDDIQTLLSGAALHEYDFLSLKPVLTLGNLKLVAAEDIALSVCKWTLKGTGPDGRAVQTEGTTSDVLRKQTDGRWLFVIDNPWGAGILG
jgi:ketosteroid isomerase-like protein